MTEYKLYDFLPEEAVKIRTEVFCEEQGFTEEFDSVDDSAVHVMAYYNGEPAATGRVFSDGNEKILHIGRVAVKKRFRSLDIGTGVMLHLEAAARRQGAEYTELGAQCQAQGFYEKCGYIPCGEVFFEQDCPHIMMRKKL